MKYVITGGPCSGKTTVLNHLSSLGFATIPEVPRLVIEDEQRKESIISGYRGIFPWADLQRFQDLVIERQLRFESSINGFPVFLDRSLVDPIAYTELGGVSLREDIHDLIRDARYTKAFYLERLPQYVVDGQRKEDLVKAIELHRKLYEVYSRLEFNIVVIPFLSLEERIRMILNEIKQ